MTASTAMRKAMRLGREQADRVLQFRNRELQKRARVVVDRAKGKRAEGRPVIAPKLVSAVGGLASDPVLVAEGDSWFDYPFNDILRLLEDRHGYEVESVAHKGDRVEDMAYGLGQLEELTRRIEKLLRRDRVPIAILLSGGGNDIAGDAFGMLLNHARSPIAGINRQICEGVISERMQVAYATILSAITRLCEKRLRRRIPIVVHGYDYPIPDGRGFLGGWGPLPGPWLEPGFRDKGFADLDECIVLTRVLIDRFNDMLATLAALPAYAHVSYLDLRGTLSRRDWDNELHPSASGFMRIADRFAALIASLS